MLPVRPEMQNAGPSTRVTVPPLPRGGLTDDVWGLVTAGHARCPENFHYGRSGIRMGVCLKA